MARQHHRVGSGIWDQPWDDDMRLVAVYLMTCRHRVMEGLYRLPPAYGPADMGWKPQRFERAFRALVADGFIEYDQAAQVVWLVNALDWQAPANPNQARAAVKALAEVPGSPLRDRFIAKAVTVSERFAKELAERFPEWLPQPFGKPVANTPSPTPTPAPTPPLTRGASSEPLASPPAKTYTFGGKAIASTTLIAAQAILADFNRQAGTRYRPFTDDDKLTQELSRIVGAMLADHQITIEVAARMTRAALTSGDRYWEPKKPHPGHVFGEKVRGPHLEQALGNPAQSAADTAKAYAAALNGEKAA